MKLNLIKLILILKYINYEFEINSWFYIVIEIYMFYELNHQEFDSKNELLRIANDYYSYYINNLSWLFLVFDLSNIDLTLLVGSFNVFFILRE